jgi:non-ribosomal peptide synthase protein (TIGR01720 family)
MDALHAVKLQLRRIPNHGIGYGALRYLSNGDVGQHLRSLPEAEVNFLYQGQRRRRTSSTATFDLVAGPIGTLHSPRTPLKYLFNLNAWIEDDRLHMDWIYSELLFRHDTVERLSQEFIHRLKSLIDASRNTRQAGWASVGSQFGWDQSDVENIAAAIAKAVGSS